MSEIMTLSRGWEPTDDGCCSTFMFNENRYKGCVLHISYPPMTCGVTVEINGVIVVTPIITEYLLPGENTIILRGDMTLRHDGTPEVCPQIVAERGGMLTRGGVYTNITAAGENEYSLSMNAEVQNNSLSPKRLKVLYTAFTPAGKQYRKCAVEHTLPPMSCRTFSASTPLKQPVLRGTEQPYLYTVRAELCYDKEVCDTADVHFHVAPGRDRSRISFAVYTGEGRGHSAFPAVDIHAMLDYICDSGFCSVCTSLSDIDGDYLLACDRLGIDVICDVKCGIGETPDMEKLRICRAHPCVTCYLVSSLEPEPDTRSVAVVSRIITEIRNISPDAEIAYICEGELTEKSFPSEICSVYSLAEAKRIHSLNKRRRVMLCLGSDISPVELADIYDKSESAGWVHSTILSYRHGTGKRGSAFWHAPWLALRLYDRNLHGVITSMLSRLPSVYAYTEGTSPCIVHTYSNCSSVGLSLSGMPVRVDKAATRCYAPYICDDTPEYIEAIGFRDGNEAARYTIGGVGAAHGVTASAVFSSPTMSVLTCYLIDDEGRAVNSGDADITVRCEGEASIIYSDRGRHSGGVLRTKMYAGRLNIAVSHSPRTHTKVHFEPVNMASSFMRIIK